MRRLLIIVPLLFLPCLSHAEDKVGILEERINTPQADQSSVQNAIGITVEGTTTVSNASSQEDSESEAVTITGEDKLKLTTKKPPLEIKENMNDAVPSYTTTEERLFSVSPPTFSIWSQDYSAVMDSKQVACPYLKKLVRETVATFYPQTKGEVITSWNLVITDDKGREFKRFNGTSVLPNNILWDGRSDKDKVIDVDTAYTYIFSYIDVVGTPHTIMGNPFSIDALVHQEKDGLVITLSSRILFDQSADDVQIKPEALSLIQEVTDEIKNYYGLPIEIEAYDDSVSLTKIQTEVLRNLLAERLLVWNEQIKTTTHRIKKQKPYINIVVNNR